MPSSAADKPPSLTSRQEKWFATILETMESETGKSVDEWVAIARTCPEGKPGARKAWLKTNFGLGTNRASIILGKAFPESAMWNRPDDLRGALWGDPRSFAILAAVEAVVAPFPDLVSAQRKGFTAFSRAFQFAAIKPLKGGKAVLGLAVEPTADPRLSPPKAEGWSERLKSKATLDSPDHLDDSLKALLKTAWEGS